MLELWHWLFLAVVVVVLFALDFLLVPKFTEVGSMRSAIIESAAWIAAGLGFSAFIWWAFDGLVMEYLAAYVVEKTLSADNLFVFAATFGYFNIPHQYQRRVLMLGILGAVVLRGIFIFAGIALLEAIDWVVYVFGAILIVTGVRLGLHALRGEEEARGENAVVRFVARVLPVDRNYQGKHFWYRTKNGICLTPMALALVAIESADVMFAVDSVPAVLAITQDRFIAYSSNVFAILGLRALYSVLAGAMQHLPLIRPALSIILVFIGIKMALVHVVEIPAWLPLAVVGFLLGAAIAGSIWMNRRSRA
jgi:tellurite resistance protein TerC